MSIILLYPAHIHINKNVATSVIDAKHVLGYFMQQLLQQVMQWCIIFHDKLQANPLHNSSSSTRNSFFNRVLLFLFVLAMGQAHHSSSNTRPSHCALFSLVTTSYSPCALGPQKYNAVVCIPPSLHLKVQAKAHHNPNYSQASPLLSNAVAGLWNAANHSGSRSRCSTLSPTQCAAHEDFQPCPWWGLHLFSGSRRGESLLAHACMHKFIMLAVCLSYLRF